jgi:acetyl esterase/lipase
MTPRPLAPFPYHCRFVAANVLIIGMLAALVASARAADDEDRGALRAEAGKPMVYKEAGGKPQTLELYLPERRSPASDLVPGVLLFHGGGWSGGDLKQFRHACDYFAKRGLVAATANYRMHTKDEAKALPAGESRKRICITDARSAIRFMKSHASEWGMDPKRLIVGGGSAGGHLALLATMKNGLDDPGDDTAIDTSAVAWLLFNPAFTLDGKDNDPQVDVFPYLRSGLPPSIFFFGTKDSWKTASDVLVPKLTELKNEATMWNAVDEGHSFWQKAPWYDLTLAESDRFLVAHGLLHGTGPAPDSAGQKLIRGP